MSRWIGFAVRAAVMALVALMLGHNLIFLAGYGTGFGHAMAHTGHDRSWGTAVAISLLLGGALLLAAVWRLGQLFRTARAMNAGKLPSEPGWRAFLVRFIPWWLALAVATAVLFVLQENVESARISSHLPGIGVLTSATYPHAIAIIVAVAFAVSFVAVLLGWELEILAARIQAAGSGRQRATPSAMPPIGLVELAHRSILGSRLAGRAPPGFAS